MIEAAILVIFPFCMVFAAVSDLLSMTIANRVSLLLLGAFIIIAPLTGMGWADFGLHLAAGGLVLCATFSLFALGVMGGGDAKLMAGTSVWMGLSMTLANYILLSSVIGGALTLAILLYRGSPMAVYSGRNVFLRHLADEKAGIPYGIALGIAGLIVFPTTSLGLWVVERLIIG